MLWIQPKSPLFPYTTLFRSRECRAETAAQLRARRSGVGGQHAACARQRSRRPQQYRHEGARARLRSVEDRKSTRLNSSHVKISYAVFCLKKKSVDELMTH